MSTSQLCDEMRARVELHRLSCDRCWFYGGECQDARLLRLALHALESQQPSSLGSAASADPGTPSAAPSK